MAGEYSWLQSGQLYKECPNVTIISFIQLFNEIKEKADEYFYASHAVVQQAIQVMISIGIPCEMVKNVLVLRLKMWHIGFEVYQNLWGTFRY